MNSSKAAIQWIVLLALFGAYSKVILAAKGWDITAGLGVQTIATDNLNLDTDNPKSDIGVIISPRFGIKRDTKRNRLFFQYRLNYLYYLNATGERNFKHFLTADWNSELYENVLFMDISANADQKLISNSGLNGGDDFNVTNNTTQTFSYSISPYTKHHLGRYADMELRYTYDQVIYSDDSDENSYGNGIKFTVNSGKKFQKVPWGITGSYRWINYDRQNDSSGSGRNDRFRIILAKAGYFINRKWMPGLFFGYENNDFDTTTNTSEGAIYGVGVKWTPNPRLSLDLAYGHRFFGDHWYLDLGYKRKRGVFTVNLTHDISSARSEVLNQQVFQQIDNFGNEIDNSNNGDPIGINPDGAAIDNEVYVLNRILAGYEHSIGHRTKLGIKAYYSSRNYQLNQRDETYRGINITWSRRLNRRTQANINFFLEKLKTDPDATNNIDTTDDNQWRILARITRQLSKKTKASFDLRYLDRDSSSPSLDYTESRATLSLDRTW